MSAQRIRKRVVEYIAHYFYGLFAAGWNGSWNAVAGIIGIDAVAIAGGPEQVGHILNWHQMTAAFVASFAIHAILWIKAHPIPDKFPDYEPVLPPPSQTPPASP